MNREVKTCPTASYMAVLQVVSLYLGMLTPPINQGPTLFILITLTISV